jgi:hypothetical protein
MRNLALSSGIGLVALAVVGLGSYRNMQRQSRHARLRGLQAMDREVRRPSPPRLLRVTPGVALMGAAAFGRGPTSGAGCTRGEVEEEIGGEGVNPPPRKET